MCIDTVSPPNVSRYDDISIYCCISNVYFTDVTYCDRVYCSLWLGEERICSLLLFFPRCEC